MEASFELLSIVDDSWDQKNIWIKELFPKDIEEIFVREKYNENEVNDEEDESNIEGRPILNLGELKEN